MNKPTLQRALLIGGLCLALPLTALASRALTGGPDDCDRPPPMGQGAGPGFGPGQDSVSDMGKGMGMMPLPRVLQRLDLSEVQRDKIIALMQAEGPRLREQAKAVHQTQAALHELSRSENFDTKRAKALADAGANAMAEMALARVGLENQVFKLLTQEQRDRMQSMDDGPRGRFNRPGRPD